MISSGDITWFRPLYRRIGVIAVCAGWAAFEFFMGEGGIWLTLAILATVYSVWLSLRVQREIEQERKT